MKNHWLKKPIKDRRESGKLTGGLYREPLGEVFKKCQEQNENTDIAYVQTTTCSANEYISLCFRGSTYYNSTQICRDLDKLFVHRGIISKHAEHVATPYPGTLFLINSMQWVYEDNKTQFDIHNNPNNVRMSVMYQIKGVKGQYAPLSHGLVTVTLFFDEIEVHLDSYEDNKTIMQR